MLTLEEEEIAEELRRELVVLLHLTREELMRLTTREEMERAFDGLSEVKGHLVAVSLDHAALKVSIPPFLRSSRLREVLKYCLLDFLGRDVAISVRLPGELADTVEASRDTVAEWAEGGRAVLCFTDEATVGEPTIPLIELKDYLDKRSRKPIEMAFPMNHYDVLCIWRGPLDRLVSGPEKLISEAYSELAKTPVSATARSLEALIDLLTSFQT